jgi:hypothetical protein
MYSLASDYCYLIKKNEITTGKVQRGSLLGGGVVCRVRLGLSIIPFGWH